MSENYPSVLKVTRQPTIEERLLVRGKPSAKPVLQMQWKQLLFLHWSWDAREIQGTLPDGLFVDTFDGKAWLAIVPFFMRRVHPMGLPCVPWLSNFLELNVRTYVHDGAGVPGVWFYSLACNQPLAVELARRFFHLNYVHARMEARIDTHNVCSYKARRRGIAEASFRYGPSGAKGACRARFARILSCRALCAFLRRTKPATPRWARSPCSLPDRARRSGEVEFCSRNGRRIQTALSGPPTT